jgi:tRNA pseudouridine55 synthase
MTPGIHLLHKPAGPTSFAALADFRAQGVAPNTRPPRTCHGGTLDPFATGLLLILVEPATRLFELLHELPKTYEGIIRWGTQTDNDDPLGQIVKTGDARSLNVEHLNNALRGFIGWREQTPPQTSNKRIDGERAYAKAHRGEAFVLPPVRVYMHEATWLEHDLPRQSRIRVIVRGGYYVRSLARELGEVLGCGAHLAELRRTAIGPWDDPGLNQTRAIAGQQLLSWLPSRFISDQEVGELRAGRAIQSGTIHPPDWQPPEGFPTFSALVRAFHQARLTFVLRQEPNQLPPSIALSRGL